MSDQRKKRLDAWWIVMQEAHDAMKAYVAVLDRSDVSAPERERMAAELLEKASRLNSLAEEIAAGK
jgi:hypothetical protein